MQNRRTSYFPANDCNVVTGMCPKGEFVAHLETYDVIHGHGHTRLAAIADLVEKLEAARILPDDYRTPFTGQDKIDWENDRRRALEMVS